MSNVPMSVIYLRVPPKLRRKLEKLANENRRTLTHEAIAAFERHVDAEKESTK